MAILRILILNYEKRPAVFIIVSFETILFRMPILNVYLLSKNVKLKYTKNNIVKLIYYIQTTYLSYH